MLLLWYLGAPSPLAPTLTCPDLTLNQVHTGGGGGGEQAWPYPHPPPPKAFCAYVRDQGALGHERRPCYRRMTSMGFSSWSNLIASF